MIDGVNDYTVGEVARLSSVSVRTLHHYDEIGLLRPSRRSEAGYRLYGAEDLARLRQILGYRALELPLERIGQILADPDADVDEHLRRQHRLLRQRRERDAALLSAIEREMEARQMGIALTPEEQLEVFGTDRFAAHQTEAEQRWGDMDAWKESQRRAAAYTKEDWLKIRAEADDTIASFAAALRTGRPPTSDVAMHLAEEHREHIARWFYPCDHAQHRAIAALYVSDPRFMKTWDEVAPGFSRYVHDAIVANAERAARH